MVIVVKILKYKEDKVSVIFHSDLNNFYASCECLVRPELAGKPVVVCGKIEDRHGIVLAKNNLAKGMGVKTGMTLFEAEKVAPNLQKVVANHDLYLKYSKLVKKIYYEYTDRVESFGIDEAWLDVTESVKLFGGAEKLANEIRERIKNEIGLTVSIGVSFNKIFAKLGSDLKKPDAVTIITKENYKDVVWKLPINALLYVGKKTERKLNELGIWTIGAIARFDEKILKAKLGKWGEMLYAYANGYDNSPVLKYNESSDMKSVGNSVTYYRDLEKIEDIKALLYVIAESVSFRMKKHAVGKAKTLHLSVVDENLEHFGKQVPFSVPTNLSSVIAKTAIECFEQNFGYIKKVRGLGISVCNFVTEEQLLISSDQQKLDKQLKLDNTIEDIRRRFGRRSVSRALTIVDKRMLDLEINGANITTHTLDNNNL